MRRTLFRAQLAQAACLLALTVAVPAIGLTVTQAPAQASAGGFYGGGIHGGGFHGGGFHGSGSVRPFGRPGGWKLYRPDVPDGDFGDDMAFDIFLWAFSLVFLFGIFYVVDRLTDGMVRAVNGPPPPPPRSRLERLLEALAQQDVVWREDAFLAHAEEAFMAVQRAWVARDQAIAADVMTPALYERHKALTDAMIARHHKNVLDQLELLATRIVHIADRLDDSQDEIWVQFTARAFDYVVDERTDITHKGRRDVLRIFKEIWKFKRDGRTWRVDALDPIMASEPPASFSEALSA